MNTQKKHYHTAGRTALLRYLRKNTKETPQTADEIYQGVTAAGAATGRSSVYRMLSDLSASGAVRKFRADATGEGYVYQFVGADGNCDGHFHLQCLSCGKVSHLKCACSNEISAHLMKTHGFAVDSGRSVLYGTCAACSAGGLEGGHSHA